MTRSSDSAPGFDTGRAYRHVFIVDSRDWFEGCRELYDARVDLVLTYDFGLRRQIALLGGAVGYLDHLLPSETMQRNNFLAYEFFRRWHVDAEGRDLFLHDGVPFGASFRIEYWNDYIFFLRARLCLGLLEALRFEKVFAGTELGLAESLLEQMGLSFTRVAAGPPSRPRYYFPIHTWMQENIRRSGLKGTILHVFATLLGTFLTWIDRLVGTPRPAVFVQEYHPTFALAHRLREEGRVRVVRPAPSRQGLWSRYIPVWPRAAARRQAAAGMLESFRSRRSARLVMTDGTDLTDDAYAIIERRVAPRLAEALATIDGVNRYLDRQPLALEVLISNIGEFVTLVDCAARARGVPSFMIINGLLSVTYLDEGKNATVINAYSTSIKEHYFRGMQNIVCLGDPRMDRYPPVARRRPARPDAFTVVIGASGHSNIDLNSYVAVEFEFLDSVLQALHVVRERGAQVTIIIKVRSNGYRQQYEHFVAEYFPGLAPQIIDQGSMADVLAKADFYISIYSQSLFEASCLGIPCLYYRADAHVFDPPFDGRSELVTVETVEELVTAIEDCRGGYPRYDAFLDRSVMEKYIGPLDGGNLQRNLDCLYGMLDMDRKIPA